MQDHIYRQDQAKLGHNKRVVNMTRDYRTVSLLAVWLTTITGLVVGLPECQDNEYHYEFTECGSDGGRWHVPVPHDPKHCTITTKSSIRQKSCDSTCPSGQYLDVSTLKEECKSCAKGTYSLGSAVRYDNWTVLPPEFDTYSVKHYSSRMQNANETSCNSTWLPDHSYIKTDGTSCITRLTYSTTIVRNEGSLSFSYYFTNDHNTIFFNVFVQNEQCQISSQDNEDGNDHVDDDEDYNEDYDEDDYSDDDDDDDFTGYEYPEPSSNYNWSNFTMKLKRGKNLVVWEVQHMNPRGSYFSNTVFINSIEVKGVSFSSECAPCRAGLYAEKEGSRWCKQCEENYISNKGSEKCSPCNAKTEYAPPGSSECLKREPCKKTDYIETSSACDKDNKFQTVHKWIEPKKCSEVITGAVTFPPPGPKQDCPPCNPGMYLNVTQCLFCPSKTFSNGRNPCKTCPTSTAPVLGHNFRWWKSLPSSIEISCYTMRSCATSTGWQLRGDYLDSGQGHADDVRLMVKIKTNGFTGEGGLVSRTASSRGMVRIDFELDCDGPCYFAMYENNYYENTDKITEWEGRHARQNFSYAVTSKHSRGYYWRFQKTREYQNHYTGAGHSFKYINDRVKIYSVVLTNTVDGGASECRECLVGIHESGCIECPKGHFVDKTNKKCKPCDKGTYLSNNTCVKCGPGLSSSAGSSKCYSSCHYHYKDGRHLLFNKLDGVHSVQSEKSFFSEGSAFIYEYHINLCGVDAPPASCHSNVSFGQKVRTRYLNASICQMRIIPDKKNGRAEASEVAGIGHQLMGIYEDKPENVSLDVFKDEKLLNESLLYFDYLSHTTTPSCPSGRSSWVILRCDSEATDKGTIKLPPACHEGTCDGCQFLFLWQTRYACPLCSENDYHQIKSGCVNRKTTIIYRLKNSRRCIDGVSLPASKFLACKDMTIHEAMKRFQIHIGIAAFVVTAIIASLMILWYKNRVLKYKLYHRVSANDSNQTEELPQVQSCMADEEDEDDEKVEFKKGGNPGMKLFKKLKGISKEDDETQKLNESFEVELS